MSTTESEVLAITKLKPRAKEGRQAYLKRLLTGLDALYGDEAKGADENWEKAGGAVQKWYEAAVKADENSKALPDFKDAKAETTEAAAPAKAKANGNGKATDTPLEAAIEKTKEPKTKEAKPAKAAKAPKEAKVPKVKAGKVTKIQALAFSNPKKGVDELTEMLAKKGIETSRATVWSVRTALMRDTAFLHGQGLLKENPFA